MQAIAVSVAGSLRMSPGIAGAVITLALLTIPVWVFCTMALPQLIDWSRSVATVVAAQPPV